MHFGVVLHIQKIQRAFCEPHIPTLAYHVACCGIRWKFVQDSCVFPHHLINDQLQHWPHYPWRHKQLHFCRVHNPCTFFHPIQTFFIFLIFTYFWNESQSNVNSLFLCTISKQTLYLTICTHPSDPICNSTQGNFITHEI
jgi:hypothetical protein